MSDAATVEGLAATKDSRTLGERFQAWRKRKFSRNRQTAEAVVAPVVAEENARRDDGVVEEVVIAKTLERETFADASVEEIITFLKGLDVSETEGADRPEAERGEFGFFGVKLSAEEKAAVLRLRTGAPVAEGEEDTTEADVALLKARFATGSSVVAEVVDVAEGVARDEVVEADADLTARTAELLALADRFAITTKDRAALALLVGISEFSEELKRIIADTHSAWKEQTDTVPVADAAEGEAPVPLAFEERAQAAFDALIVALEARQSQASAPADVEQAQTLAVEGGSNVVVVDEAPEDGVVVAPVEGDDHSAQKRSED